MSSQIGIVERDEAGRALRTRFIGNEIHISKISEQKQRIHVLGFIKKVFLPVGYPETVSPDYLRYQIFNALQAFCSAVAGMLSSRAILEGFGVGDPSASATHALLLTVLQDVFSRLTTIVGAYLLGSSLFAEAKFYRFLADILNDTAITLDTLSPLLTSPSLPFKIPGIRVAALCLSASLRSLCGIAAGGSKAALTVHFSTPSSGMGDVGDLNAKDASKETVVALIGMLLGTIIVPYLTNPLPTYSVLFFLVASHLTFNYMAVRGLELRSLNRQRTALLWTAYRESGNSKVLSPAHVSTAEQLFERPGIFRDPATNEKVIHCTIGSSFSSILRSPVPSSLLNIFDGDRYLLWFDHQSLLRIRGQPGQLAWGPLRLHICLKEGHMTTDHLKAWVHAGEIGRMWTKAGEIRDDDEDQAITIIRVSYRRVHECFPTFRKGLLDAGWNTVDGALMTGSPKTILTSITESQFALDGEDDEKKFK